MYPEQKQFFSSSFTTPNRSLGLFAFIKCLMKRTARNEGITSVFVLALMNGILMNIFSVFFFLV